MTESRRKRILVVEDNDGSREYLFYLLTRSGHEVQSAAEGGEALELIRSFRPDLIISDILMPGIDGFELIRRLRAEPSSANIPVVLYSATYHQSETQRLLKTGGLIRRIEKPAEPEVILQVVEEALRQPPAPELIDPATFSEQHLRLVSEKLVQKVQALTTANLKLEETRRQLEAEVRTRSRLEQDLRESESRLRQITACAPVGIFQLLPSGECLFANDWWLATTGLPPQKCLGWGWAQAIHPAEREPVIAALKKILAEGGSYQGEFRVFTTRQETRWVIARTEPLKSLDGSISGHVGMVLDITERRRLEEQLRQAQKLEAIGQLVAGVAHDFNNLLALIMGNTELALLRLEATNPVAPKLLDIKSATDKAAALIRQLLMFSRQEIHEPRKIDLNPAISISSHFLHRLIGENISVQLRLTEDPIAVFIDPGHLEQVLMNLLVNARDAMPEGGTVTIETSIVDLSSKPLDPDFSPAPGKYALLSITDSGHGMDAATKAHIFEPFFSTKDRSKGTGLGLATVEGIVRQAGGHIAAYSEIDRGTTFRIFLPLSSGTLEAPAEEEKELAMGRGETILLVEDEPPLRNMVRQCLEESGYKVLKASDGIDAIAVGDKHEWKIDLLLSDAVMPRMGGVTLLSEVAGRYPSIQLMLMSGYTQDAKLRQSKLRSIRVIQKPFTRAALLHKIRTALDAAKPPSKRHTILLAEDDPNYRELIEDTLQTSGFEVLSSKDGTRALLHGLSHRIDLALLDVLMPRASGFAICRKLRANPATASVPIIVMSGLTTQGDQRRALDAGANLFLRKPFSTDELVSTINTLLANRTAPGIRLK